MNEKKIIKEAMKSVGWNLQQLADASGYSSAQAVSNRINSGAKGMRLDTFTKLINAMGYEVEIRSKSRENKNRWVVMEERPEDKAMAEIANLSAEAKRLLGIEV